jgi:hypothetical protein
MIGADDYNCQATTFLSEYWYRRVPSKAELAKQACYQPLGGRGCRYYGRNDGSQGILVGSPGI